MMTEKQYDKMKVLIDGMLETLNGVVEQVNKDFDFTEDTAEMKAVKALLIGATNGVANLSKVLRQIYTNGSVMYIMEDAPKTKLFDPKSN